MSVIRSISSPRTMRSPVQADLGADVPGDQLVVAGEDLHLHAVALEGLQSIGGILQRRVDERQETGQHQVALVRGTIRILPWHGR